MADAVASHLDLMDAQRARVFDALQAVPEPTLWRRPAPRKWSAAEHLDHTRALNRCFPLTFLGVWPILLPLAALRRGRPYPTEIDDVYQRPNMPTRVGWLWPPRYGPDAPVPLEDLRRDLEAEHNRNDPPDLSAG